MTADLDALPVLDVVSIEWPDEDQPCSGKACPHPAVFWAEHECGATIYACHYHRLWVDSLIEKNKRGRCKGRCGQSWVPVHWKSLR